MNVPGTSDNTTNANKRPSSKRTSDAARRSAGQVTPLTNISDGALDTHMVVTVTDEGMESPEAGDDDENTSGKDVEMDGYFEEDKVRYHSL